MDFTRQPVIESVVTPKEGCKLAVRSSKGAGHEEFFVDAVEVVSFGSSYFFRSTEKPKSFLLPVSDYEVVEVREPRMTLKTSVKDKSSIKIAGGRQKKDEEKPEKLDRPERKEKKEKKRLPRRRRVKEEAPEVPTPAKEKMIEQKAVQETSASEIIQEILTPPPLISETIARYKDDHNFSGAFYEKEAEGKDAVKEAHQEEPKQPVVAVEQKEDLWNFQDKTPVEE